MKAPTRTRPYKLPRNFTALGEYLQHSRELCLLTQRRVSLKLGYSSAQFISNFERGISAPPMKRLRVLLKMYKCDEAKVVDLYLLGVRAEMQGVLKK